MQEKPQEKPAPKEVVQTPVTTPAPVAPTKAAEPLDDEHNIEVYECKGDFDDNDKLCSDCPVRTNCEEVHPIYIKAKQMGVNTDPHRPTKEVVADVKKQEKPAEEAAPSRRGKKIPF